MRHLLLIALIGCTACAAPDAPPSPATAPAPNPAEGVHSHETELVMTNADAVVAHFPNGVGLFEAPASLHGIQQIGLLLEGDAAPLHWRARQAGVWSEFEPVELTWSEGTLHVGRVLTGFNADAVEIGGAEGITAATLDIFGTRQAPLSRLTRTLPFAIRKSALALPDFVITREAWGARDPQLICNDIVQPYRMTVHHTASPDDDGGDAAARMRQMQAYHIDSRGWCDFGYHFVVSQAGDIYEGRRGEDRPAAHTGGQNDGNIGISLIGNFEEQEVGEAQFSSAARIMGWVFANYEIPPNRDAVRGHLEWPGASTACPGRNLLPRLEALIDDATATAPDPTGLAVDLTASWLDGVDRHLQGSSAGVIDLVDDEVAHLELRLHNGAEESLTGVVLAYELPAGAEAVAYVIESDAPHFDGERFSVNDANSAPENPASLGEAGDLTMYALAAGETKRVRVTVRGAYDGGWRPTPRAWVRHIDGVYEQARYGAAPSVNATAQMLEASAPVDVLSGAAWTFMAEDEQDAEGWRACTGELLRIDPSAHALQMPEAQSSCVAAPSWTVVDTDDWRGVALRLNNPNGPTDVVLNWYDGAVRFAARPGRRTYVLDLSAHSMWTGQIGALAVQFELDASDDAPTLEAVFAIDPETGEGVGGLTDDAAPTDWTSQGDEPFPVFDAGVDPGVDAGAVPAVDGGVSPELDSGGGGDSGCSVAHGVGQRGATGLTILGLALLSFVLRRRQSQS